MLCTSTTFNLTSNHASLFFALFLVAAVLSLDCYVCGSSATNDECNNNNQTCQAPLDTCMTTIDILGNNENTTPLLKNIKNLYKKCLTEGNFAILILIFAPLCPMSSVLHSTKALCSL